MQDLIYILQWWVVFFILGIIFLPITSYFFQSFKDYGYSFSKVLGIAFVTYALFLLATIRILPFGIFSLITILLAFSVINFFILKKGNIIKDLRLHWNIFLTEELLFLLGICFWSYIRAHQPDINGLEKFMDFGFVNSILRTEYLPAKDMWFTPLSINYYYFGHFVTAVLTKLSTIPSYITYNLMIATLFSFAFVLSFSIVFNLVSDSVKIKKAVLAGIIGGLLVSFSGNLHTIYSFFAPYDVDNPVPFWNLALSIGDFPNSYWYPNATRFIPFTIHEFPLYSFVVSDLHGHVIDIMFVLLGIASTYLIFISKKVNYYMVALISFFISIMYMTNAWDGLIYMLLTFAVIATKNVDIGKIKGSKTKKSFLSRVRNLRKLDFDLFGTLKDIALIIILFVIFSLPFNIYFKPFASGIGILCAPGFLTNIGRLGPLIFEPDHCQTTPWWQFVILYGFFYFFVISFLVFIYKRISAIRKSDVFVLILIFISSLLILMPEFVYVKDIYPAHYRANTMFKLVYQSFIMLSIVCAYTFFRIKIKNRIKNAGFHFISLLLLAGVLVYPQFAINSYYGELKNYKGLDGTAYLRERHPGDYAAIDWINENIYGQPVILEAQGDSYTDYGRISTNTGLPTILGWAVHEWLWRGTYDIPAPRIEEVKSIYESGSLTFTKSILSKYGVDYIVVGDLEREKYPDLIESKFQDLGVKVFESGNTRIYKVN